MDAKLSWLGTAICSRGRWSMSEPIPEETRVIRILVASKLLRRHAGKRHVCKPDDQYILPAAM